MFSLPDLSGLFWFALFGIACAVIGGAGVLGWVGYHLTMALLLYWGV